MIQNGVFIGLGSNLDDPAQQVKRAMVALDSEPGITVLKSSSLYQTEPVGLAGQPDYINAAVEIKTTFSPFELLSTLKRIETACGRVNNGVFWGPRLIDLDLLLYGMDKIEDRRLRIPHPEIDSRLFVLLPLLEIAPELEIPDKGRVSTLISLAPKYRTALIK